jgi:hypothetical protein
MMNSEGVIALMKQALLFYAKESNYTFSSNVGGNFSKIELDKGYQARFALKQLEDQEKAEADMNIDWTNFKEPDTNLEDIEQIIKDNPNK